MAALPVSDTKCLEPTSTGLAGPVKVGSRHFFKAKNKAHQESTKQDKTHFQESKVCR